jgi:hypothetical protein
VDAWSIGALLGADRRAGGVVDLVADIRVAAGRVFVDPGDNKPASFQAGDSRAVLAAGGVDGVDQELGSGCFPEELKRCARIA